MATELPTELEPKIVRANLPWVLNQIADGRSINAIADDLQVAPSVISGLRRLNSQFRAQFNTARALAAHQRADEMLDIADGLAQDPDVDPVKAADRQIDVRKWLAARWAPELYGDKAQAAPAANTTVNVDAGGLHLAAVKQANQEPIEGEIVDDGGQE